MRRIVKGIPVKSLMDFAKLNKKATWEQVAPKVRRDVVEGLANEQLNLDGYTERLLELDDKNTHIDHFKKRTLFPQLTFKWDNLILAEHSMAFGADAKDNYSKDRVKRKEDYLMVVDPVYEDPHQYFSYLLDGAIVPKAELNEKEKQKAQYTIDCFCLNNIALKQGRCDVIEAIKSLKNGDCSSNDILNYLSDYNYPSVLEYFCSPEVFCVL